MTAEITELPEYGAERSLQIEVKGGSVFVARSDADSQLCLEFDRTAFTAAIGAELGITVSA